MLFSAKVNKRSSSGHIHIIFPLLAFVTVAAIGSYVVTSSYAAQPSITLNSKSGWSRYSNLSKPVIAKDGKTSVVNIKAASNTAHYAGAVYLNKNTKLRNFVTSHEKHKFKICFTARALTSSQVQFQAYQITNSANATITKNVNLGNTYKKYCYNGTFAAASFIGNGKYSDIDVVNNGTSDVYVKSVVLSLR